MKSATDEHWSNRASENIDNMLVNIPDACQRELEYDFILRHLSKEAEILEVGCGNGYSTERFRRLAKHIDSIDYSQEMIERAKETYGEINNRFFYDNILKPQYVTGPYDIIICVRTLINLRNLEEQQLAVENMAILVKKGGKLILVEGCKDGFNRLNDLRAKVNMPPIQPAKINYYSTIGELLHIIKPLFSIVDEYHIGCYDYLTRIIYPFMVGPNNVQHNSEFAIKAVDLVRAFNPDSFKEFSRVRGFLLRRR